MQEILIPATDTQSFDTAQSHLNNRSFLYDRDNHLLYIKYAGEMRLLNIPPDNETIKLNDTNDKLSLADNPHCKSLLAQDTNTSPMYVVNKLMATMTSTKTILLLFKLDLNGTQGTVCGQFFEKGNTVTSGINVSASVNGSKTISGSSTSQTLPYFCRCTYNNEEYLGIQFHPDTIIYFTGFTFIPDNNQTLLSYVDADFTSIVPENN